MRPSVVRSSTPALRSACTSRWTPFTSRPTRRATSRRVMASCPVIALSTSQRFFVKVCQSNSIELKEICAPCFFPLKAARARSLTSSREATDKVTVFILTSMYPRLTKSRPTIVPGWQNYRADPHRPSGYDHPCLLHCRSVARIRRFLRKPRNTCIHDRLPAPIGARARRAAQRMICYRAGAVREGAIRLSLLEMVTKPRTCCQLVQHFLSRQATTGARQSSQRSEYFLIKNSFTPRPGPVLSDVKGRLRSSI